MLEELETANVGQRWLKLSCEGQMKEKWGTIAAFSVEGKDDFSMERYELVWCIGYRDWNSRKEESLKTRQKMKTHKLNFLSSKVCIDTTKKDWGHCKFIFFFLTRVPGALSQLPHKFSSLLCSHVQEWWSWAVSVGENFQKKVVTLKWNEEQMGRDLGREMDINWTWEEFDSESTFLFRGRFEERLFSLLLKVPPWVSATKMQGLNIASKLLDYFCEILPKLT